MEEPVPEDLLQFLKEYKCFLIISHREPDGDTITSAIALSLFLSRMGKRTKLFSPGPFNRPEIAQFNKYFNTKIEESDRLDPGTAVIILDCSTEERIGCFSDAIRGLKVAVIDHHSSGDSFGDLTFIRPGSPSVTYLIQRIIEALGEKPSKEEAELIMFGLCTDTGFFRHLGNNSSHIFEATARLVQSGVSPNEIYHKIYGQRSLHSRVLLGRLLSRTETYFNGKLLLTYETIKDTEQAGKINRDSDTLYQLLQTVESVEVVVLIREEEKGACSVGMRANGSIDLGELAYRFGGGGHRKAAGFIWKGSMEEIKKRLLSTLSEMLLHSA
ncbi:MAG: bifunctional oligoribonuclease/PAP phosphatase NrnA [Spirochaetes bacterium]|nr:MAG: bifunctional oligoribonuclease/PAP phosphatase NrnA [Spirochaetota bacterium]